MKTIVISDTHLTPHFEQKKFSYLEKIIKKSDQVIINGDFWDGYLCSFEEFTKSSWRKLFPLLKSKESVYLFGNHDPKKWATKKTNLFSKRQYSSLKISLNEFNLHIQHGNSIKPSIGERHPWVANKLTARLASTFLGVGVRCFGPDFYKKYYPRARLTDSKLRNWAQKNLPPNQILLCSHSHIASNSIEKKYLNTGFILYGYAHYIAIEKKGLELIKERY